MERPEADKQAQDEGATRVWRTQDYNFYYRPRGNWWDVAVIGIFATHITGWQPLPREWKDPSIVGEPFCDDT